MNNFSPNMLKTFDECQTKFFFKYIKKLSVPQDKKLFEKGKKIHALASYYLNGEDVSKMERVLSAEEKTTWDVLKSNKYFKLKMLNTEYNLSCKVKEHWIGGRLDALMSDGTGNRKQETEGDLNSENHSTIQPFNSSTNYYILDYKTGSIPKNAEQDFQTIVYLLCADKFLRHKNISYKSLQFVYLGLKDDVEKVILLDENLKKQYEEKIALTCDKIDLAINSKVFSKNTFGCEKCEYNKICKI